jgi:hypothetical protein
MRAFADDSDAIKRNLDILNKLKSGQTPLTAVPMAGGGSTGTRGGGDISWTSFDGRRFF